jgi:hypothetical protein
MPLYPCFALLIGLAIERCAEGTQAAGYGKLWRHFLSVAAAVMLAAGAAVLGASLWKGRLTEFAQPLPFAAVYLVVAATLGATVFCSRAAATKGQRVAAVLGVAAFLGITSVGVVTNAKMYGCARTAEEVAELKQKLPPDVKLISIGPIGHGFAYHYGQPIEMRKPYEAACATGFTYFCAAEEPRLDFPWEKVAFINCDRNQSEHPKDKVIVGRRLQGSRDTH